MSVSPQSIPGTTPKAEVTGDTAHADTRNVNIRGVPTDIWCKARQNALTSRMAFKHYVIRLLSESTPFLDQANAEAIK